MVNDHYIELNEKTIEKIVPLTYNSRQTLNDALQDAKSDDFGMPYFVVLFRKKVNNYVQEYMIYTMVELAIEFRLKKIDPNSKENFIKC